LPGSWATLLLFDRSVSSFSPAFRFLFIVKRRLLMLLHVRRLSGNRDVTQYIGCKPCFETFLALFYTALTHAPHSTAPGLSPCYCTS
jgi:hypothetical protein